MTVNMHTAKENNHNVYKEVGLKLPLLMLL